MKWVWRSLRYTLVVFTATNSKYIQEPYDDVSSVLNSKLFSNMAMEIWQNDKETVNMRRKACLINSTY